MKQSVLNLLQQRLEIVEYCIDEYSESLAVGLKCRHEFTTDGIDTLNERLTDFKQQKVEIEQCINWVKSL